MSYADELRTNYREAHKRLWSGAFPSEAPACRSPCAPLPEPPMTYSGLVTGGMWNGVSAENWDVSPMRKGRDIIQAVLIVTGVRRVDFASQRRAYVFVEARQLACWFMRHYSGLSFPQIGNMIGGRDHSTVIHGMHRVSANPDLFGKRIAQIAVVLKIRLPEEVAFQ